MPEALVSWRDTSRTEAIVSFTEEAAASLPAEERVAVFDNDGTLWCEKPLAVQTADTLSELVDELEKDGIELRLANERQPTLEILDRSGLTERVRIAASLDEATG